MSRKLYWYQEKDEDLAGEILERYIQAIDEAQSNKIQNDLENLRCYSAREYSALAYLTPEADVPLSNPNVLKKNLVKMISDYFVERLSAEPWRVKLLTNRGDYLSAQRSRDATDFVDAVFQDCDILSVQRAFALCGVLFGDAFLKVYRVDSEIRIDNVHPGEIRVDNRSKNPLTMAHVFELDRDALIARYPDLDDRLQDCGPIVENRQFLPETSDPVGVIDAIRLPVGEKKGRRIIRAKGVTLSDTEWERPYFPILKWDCFPANFGYWAGGIVDPVKPFQLEMNYCLQKLQRYLNSQSTKILLRGNAQMLDGDLNNEDFGFIRTMGAETPIIFQIPGPPPELFSHIDRITRDAFEALGGNQALAKGMHSPGLDSAKAVREERDVSDVRIANLKQRFDAVSLEIGKRVIDLATEISQENGLVKKAKGSGMIRTIDWAELNKDEDEWTVAAYPVSFLSKTPSGRLADIERLAQFPQFQELVPLMMDYEDIKAVTEVEFSERRLLEKTAALIREKGEMIDPSPWMDLQSGIKWMAKAFIHAQLDEVPDSKLRLFAAWLTKAKGMLEAAMPPAPPPGAPPGGMPPPPEAAPPIA